MNHTPTMGRKNYGPENTGGTGNWDCSNLKCNTDSLVFAAVSTALIAIAGVATYYCIVNGFTMLDYSHSALTTFGGGFLIYAGVVFSAVTVANALFFGGRIWCHAVNHETPFNYPPSHAISQVAVSILSPIAVLPLLVVGGICVASKA